MKKMKRIICLLLAMVLVLGMSMTVLAAEEGGPEESPKKPTITAPVGNYTYNVYQIFTGVLSDDGVLSDIKWGQNGSGEKGGFVDSETLKALEGLTTSKNSGNATDKDVLNYLLSKGADGNYLYVNLNTAYASLSGGGEITVEPGYYLIRDAGTIAEGDASTLYIVEVAGDVEVKRKTGTPEVEKQVQENLDGSWGNSADYNIGDTVKFRLIGTLPENYDMYDTYTFTFHDALSEGLTFDGVSSVKVYQANVSKTEDEDEKVTYVYELADDALAAATYYKVVDYNVVDENVECAKKIEGCNLEISFSDPNKGEENSLSWLPDYNGIVVEYTAKLNEKAVIAGLGNPNKVILEYSNNPNPDGEGDTGTTPEKEVVVFTFGLEGHKVDGDVYDSTNDKKEEAALADAEFVLYKEVDDAKLYAVVNAKGKVIGWVSDLDADLAEELGIESAEGLTTTITSRADGLFFFEGLDTGTYYLEETKAPSSYNSLAGRVEIEIIRENGSITIKVNGVEVGVEGTGEDAQVSGSVHFEVKNFKGAVLPSTGGIGTTIFYVIGGILVVGCGVILVTRKRVGSKN